ncbi:MAG: glycosyltransferase family 39 protein [Planctomycetaceae bacterium]|nr:glycosyltransferase family 39 protein [Planctomycetaceae bacterium]
MLERHYGLSLWTITVAAWVLRIAVTAATVGLVTPLDPEDGLDQLDYEQFAFSLSGGQGYCLQDGTPSARRAPGTSLVLLPVFWVCGRSLLAARLWIMLLSALTCVAAAGVIRPRGGPVAALWTAGLIAVNPVLIYYSTHLWSEVPFILVTTLATGWTVRLWEQHCWSDAWKAGLAFGCAILIRPQVIFVIPFALSVLGILHYRRQMIPWRQVGFALALSASVVAPWVVRNALVMGSPSLATLVGGCTFWGAHNATTFNDPRWQGRWVTITVAQGTSDLLPADEVRAERIAWNRGFQAIREHQTQLPRLFAAKLYRLLTPFEETPNRWVYWSFAMAWIGGVLGLLAGGRELWRRDRVLFTVIALQWGATLVNTILFYGCLRFRHVHEAQFMIMAGMGLAVSLAHWPAFVSILRQTMARPPALD